MTLSAEERLAAVAARRAERAELAAAAAAEQAATDAEAIDDLRVLHGDSNIETLTVAYVPDLPNTVAVRTPKSIELKRYRDRIAKDVQANAVAAAEELACVVVVYPTAEEFDRLHAARPGLKTLAGLASLKLASAVSESEGKG